MIFNFLLTGFLTLTWAQNGAQCGTGYAYNTAVSSCLPVAQAQGSSCCDPALISCQDAIKLCMANPTAGINCQTLACSSPSPLPTFSCCDPAMTACQIAIRMCLMNTTNPQLCQALACPTASVSPVRSQTASPMPRQTEPTASASASAMTTYKQTEPSASPKQADVSASATTTYKQTEPSVSNTPKQTEPSASSSATPRQVDPIAPSSSLKPTPSVYPTRFIKYSFSIRPRPSQYLFPLNAPPPGSVSSSVLFPKANHTLLRSPAKLQELQIILGCILQLPLESIEIVDIAANSVSLPFDSSIPRLRSNGEIMCINLPILTGGAPVRILQTTSDVTVTYNILNANNLFMIDKKTFATTVASDPNLLSYASSVGSSNPTADPPIMLFTLISPDPSTVPAQSPSAGAIVGGIFGGILVAGLLGIIVFAVVRLRHRAAPISAVKKPSVAVSNPMNCTNSSHVVFNPVSTRRST